MLYMHFKDIFIKKKYLDYRQKVLLCLFKKINLKYICTLLITVLFKLLLNLDKIHSGYH